AEHGRARAEPVLLPSRAGTRMVEHGKPEQGGGNMAVTSHSIPAELVAGVATGDDQSIERAFHSLFPALVAQADADLHDKASSSRVVERAFLQVMSGAPPANAQAFDEALGQAIHQAVVREQS